MTRWTVGPVRLPVIHSVPCGASPTTTSPTSGGYQITWRHSVIQDVEGILHMGHMAGQRQQEFHHLVEVPDDHTGLVKLLGLHTTLTRASTSLPSMPLACALSSIRLSCASHSTCSLRLRFSMSSCCGYSIQDSVMSLLTQAPPHPSTHLHLLV